jgi:hypothetical protein
MTYMIKFTLQSLLPLLMMTSCSFISYNQVIPLMKQSVIGSPDIELTKEFIDEQRYSFIRVDLGKGANIIMVLLDIESNFYTWVSATGEKLITYNGKVVRSEGLIYNLRHINPESFKLFSSSGFNAGTFNLMLENPKAFVEQEFKITLIDSSKDPLLFEEEINVSILNRNYSNYYWLDRKSGRVTKSKQLIHPKLPKIRIDYVYKF